MKTIYSALIGNPVDHSVSDVLFGELFRALNYSDNTVEYEHRKINVKPENLKAAVQNLSLDGSCIGYNVTLPYKIEIVKYFDSLDKTSMEIGAVNTVNIKNQTSTGYNTDWIGLLVSIRKFTKTNNPKVCIFGSGGASRAAIYAAKQISDNIVVLYREYPNISSATRELIKKKDVLGIKLDTYANVKDIISGSKIIINTTSTGMIGVKDDAPFDLSLLNGIDLTKKLFIDAVFNPVNTPLIKYLNSNGANTVDGLWMMIYQATKALSIWLDREIIFNSLSLGEIHNKLEEAINES